MSGILQTLFLGAVGVVKDAYFNLVTLLLNTTTTNGAQNNTFLDSSSNNFTITRNGNTTQGTFTPFSQTGWGNYFDGSSYLTAPSGASVSGNSAFTVDFWVFMPVANTGARIVSGAANQLTINMSSDGSMAYGKNGVVDVITVASGTSILGQWTHIAIGKSGANGTARIWRNGTSIGTATDSQTYTAGTVYIGSTSVPSLYLTGYISNLRITNTDVYGTSNTTITVPTSPLTAISGTSLLTCQSNRFVDNSSNAFAISTGGTPSVQAFSPFAPTTAYSTSTVGGSGYFDGNGDYLTIPSSASFNIEGGAYTIETFVYFNSVATFQRIFVFAGTSQTYGLILGSSNTNNLEINLFGTGTTLTATNAFANCTKAWAHVCVVSDGTNRSIFVNGTRYATTTSALFQASNNSIGIAGISGTYAGGNPDAYFSNFRIVKGTAVYSPTSTTLTVPTAPLTAITNTVLLLNFTNAGIYDAAAKNDLETVGNAQVSTTQAKFGTTSMYFDGTGDRLVFPTSIIPASGAITIEMFVYANNTTGAQCLISQYDASNSGRFQILWNSVTSKFVLSIGGSNTIVSTNTYSTATWYYLAVVKDSSNNWTMYVDGSSAGTATNSTAIAQLPTFVGDRSTTDTPFNGYIDELRITRFARTISGVPTAPFPVQ